MSAGAIDRLGQASCRIENMWPVPMTAAPDSLMNAFEDADLPTGLAHFAANWSSEDRAGLADSSTEAWEELFGEMGWQGKTGFVLVAAVPVYKRSGPSSASCSWGNYHTQAFYGESVDAVLNEAASWAEAKFAAVIGASS